MLAQQGHPSGPRQDIQALRALAVLLVVAHHFSLARVSAGFLGVDIFFVVSGYLMGGIILRGPADGRPFRFRDFYIRRLRRLAPAAALTSVVTLGVGTILLDPFEQHDLWRQALGALTLSSNIVLWAQTDYFGSGSALKPLLHFWSLAVEEQFYLLLPLVLLLADRLRTALVLGATLASAALCFMLVSRSPSATFYFLPTRAWEPGLGVLLAMGLAGRAGQGKQVTIAPGIVRVAKAAAWICLIAVPLMASDAGHPGLAALTVCLATLVILLPVQTGVPHWLRGVTAIGDRSYSLYLVHWPPLALMANLYVDTPPPETMAAAALAVIVLTEFQYRLVETPMRQAGVSLRKVMLWPSILALMLLLLCVQGGGRDDAGSGESRAANMGLGYECTSQEHFLPTAQCTSKPQPGIMVWGDSLAMHLVPGLVQADGKGVVQATRWVCGPVAGIAPVNRAYSTDWARSCIAWNQSVLDSLAQMPSVKVVVLSSIFSPYVERGEPGWTMLDQSGLQPRRNRVLLKALRDTVAAVRATGRRVVLVAPVPSASYDIGRCLVRHASGLPNLGRHADCTLLQVENDRNNAAVRAFLAEVIARDIVPVVDPAVAMCQQGRCVTQQGNISLYRDAVHLSHAGSRWLERRMDLERLVWMKAR